MYIGGPKVNIWSRQVVMRQEGCLKMATVLFAAIKGKAHFVTRST
jgi:hypothetical protein